MTEEQKAQMLVQLATAVSSITWDYQGMMFEDALMFVLRLKRYEAMRQYFKHYLTA